MGMPPNRLSELDSSSSARAESPSSSSANSSVAASGETETGRSQRYVLPKGLDAAIRHLDDQQLDRLIAVALEERARRKRPLALEKTQRNPITEAGSTTLPQGKLNAVRAAFKAGVTPARIAREFGISRSDVQRVLSSDAKK